MDLLIFCALGAGLTYLYLNIEGSVWSRVVPWLIDLSAVKIVKDSLPQSVPLSVSTANIKKAKSWAKRLSSPFQKRATSAAADVLVFLAAHSDKSNTVIANLKIGTRRKYYINYSYPLKGGA